MPEKLVLTTARARAYAPGVTSTTAAFDIMSFKLHREPTFDAVTGALTGWQAAGSYVDVLVVGAQALVETVRIYEGQAALDKINQLNTANLSLKSLRQHLMEAVEASAPKYDGLLA